MEPEKQAALHKEVEGDILLALEVGAQLGNGNRVESEARSSFECPVELVP